MAEKKEQGCKIALLSNVNMNFVIRMLQGSVSVYEAEGYGNELGILMNPASSYYAFEPKITFLVMDLMELLEHELEVEAARVKIEGWFVALEGVLKSSCIYYIADAFLWGMELGAVCEVSVKQELEFLWLERLKKLCREYQNVRILPYHQLVENLGGENVFSSKMWYMGRILLSNEAQKRLCELILSKVELEYRVPKKVLLLDLDYTLWGGIAGEADHTPIVLSDDHAGLAYKNLQRVVLQMQKQGVILAIVSKNNEEDAMKILKQHPHMVLRPECFAAKRINWSAKHENILEIGKELNLGTDSFVFWDDNPAERKLVQEMLPEVVVPDFPKKPEEFAPAMLAVYHQYFEKVSFTKEDLEKTKQYAANAERNRLQAGAVSFEEYLKQLEIVIIRVNPEEHIERLVQLVNKTNQFNLTTRRYKQNEMQEILGDTGKKVYLYQVKDRFGDNGIVSAVIVNLTEEVPIIEEFVMSCRVMGKNIEYGMIAGIEKDLFQAGFQCLQGMYLPTAKNKPVEKLYEILGYEKIKELPEGGACYQINLKNVPHRAYFGKIE